MEKTLELNPLLRIGVSDALRHEFVRKYESSVAGREPVI